MYVTRGISRGGVRAAALMPLLVVLLAGCGGAADPPAAATSNTRPNVVFILIDTLRADRVHAERHGRPVMPFLSGMARESAWYPNAISPSSWTKPALASIITGVYPYAHGIVYSARLEDPERPTSDRLAESWTTLAERFTSAGYTTWAFQTNANLAPALGFDQGYEAGHYHFHNGAPAEAVTSAAIAALPSLDPPFFLYAHYMDPHAPYRPDPDVAGALGPMPDLPAYDQALIDDDARFMAYYLDQVQTAIGLQPAHTIPDLSEAGKEAVRHRYDLECLAADRAVETLVRGIRAVEPNTVFVVLSDHGEEFWERGGMGHGVTLHQEQIRVPLIIDAPFAEPAEHAERVSVLTVLQDLWGRLGVASRESPGGAALSFTRGPWASLGVDQRAIVHEGAVWIEDSAGGRHWLFDLDADPGELDDRSGADPDRAERLRSLLEESQPRSRAGAVEGAALSESDLEALDAVGYLGGRD